MTSTHDDNALAAQRRIESALRNKRGRAEKIWLIGKDLD